MCLLFVRRGVDLRRLESGTVKKTGFILGVGALLLAGVQSAFALLVGISATWDATSASNNHLQDGSIVQVVAYSAANGGSYPGSTTGPTAGDENFVQYGSTSPALADGNPNGHVYLMNTTVASGNQIIYTGTMHDDGTGRMTFQTYVYLDNASAYDHIYIRVFSTTDFPDDGTPVASYWGISAASNITARPGTLGLVWWTNVALPNQDYFEVIPEPGTLGMLGSGAFGVGVAGLWRRGRKKGKTRAGETGVVEP